MFGLDADQPSLFRETLAFVERVKLSVAQFAVLTPFPGTPVFDELKQEGRITSFDWSLYTMGNVVYQPRKMTADELLAGRVYAYQRFYSLPSIAHRMLVRRGGRGRGLLRTAVNLSYRRRLRGGKITDTLPGERATVPAPRQAAEPIGAP